MRMTSDAVSSSGLEDAQGCRCIYRSQAVEFAVAGLEKLLFAYGLPVYNGSHLRRGDLNGPEDISWQYRGKAGRACRGRCFRHGSERYAHDAGTAHSEQFHGHRIDQFDLKSRCAETGTLPAKWTICGGGEPFLPFVALFALVAFLPFVAFVERVLRNGGVRNCRGAAVGSGDVDRA